MAAISNRDVWVVGHGYNQYENNDPRDHAPHDFRPVFLHWDGQTLVTVTGVDPDFSADYIDLKDVAAVSSNDVWAVGSYLKIRSERREQPVIFHWDVAITLSAPG